MTLNEHRANKVTQTAPKSLGKIAKTERKTRRRETVALPRGRDAGNHFNDLARVVSHEVSRMFSCELANLTKRKGRLCEHALEHAHVALTPGRDFGECGADTYVRLSYAASAAALLEAIERLGQLMDRLRTKPKPVAAAS